MPLILYLNFFEIWRFVFRCKALQSLCLRRDVITQIDSEIEWSRLWLFRKLDVADCQHVNVAKQQLNVAVGVN